jgi:hypothetical protein
MCPAGVEGLDQHRAWGGVLERNSVHHQHFKGNIVTNILYSCISNIIFGIHV